MGMEPERVEMFNLSSSEGPKFAAIAKEMVERTLKLGPSPMKQRRTGRLAGHPTQSRRGVRDRGKDVGGGGKGSGTGVSPVDL